MMITAQIDVVKTSVLFQQTGRVEKFIIVVIACVILNRHSNALSRIICKEKIYECVHPFYFKCCVLDWMFYDRKQQK